jgi:uroporphyrinogen-III synthase
MRLLITRPREDAEALAAMIAARGHETIIAPMMEVHFRAGPSLPLDQVQAILATSANGVRALRARSTKRDITVYAVGPQTADAAARAGFHPVIGAEGDSAALAEVVAARADPGAGPLLHAAGAETAGRLSQSLQSRGFAVQVVVLYDALPAAALPEEAATALAANALDGVLLFSPRTARTFAGLVATAKLEQSCARMEAFCISAATAAALQPLSFARVAVAGVPNQAAMLSLLPAVRSG